MTIYSAIVNGIYRHETLGTYSTLANAERAAIAFLDAEKDGYHSVLIVRTELNAMPVIVPSADFYTKPEVAEYVVGCIYRQTMLIDDEKNERVTRVKGNKFVWNTCSVPNWYGGFALPITEEQRADIVGATK